jgi:hypothetical protein
MPEANWSFVACIHGRPEDANGGVDIDGLLDEKAWLEGPENIELELELRATKCEDTDRDGESRRSTIGPSYLVQSSAVDERY